MVKMLIKAFIEAFPWAAIPLVLGILAFVLMFIDLELVLAH